MKQFIRTLYPQDRYWRDENEQERLRNLLNKLGFYVVHGKDDRTLDVYTIKEDSWYERYFL